MEGAESAPAIALHRTDAHADPKVLVEVMGVFYVRALARCRKVPTRAVRAERRSDWRCGASLRRQGRKSGPLVVRQEISLHGRTISGGSGPRATVVRRLLVVVEELQLAELIPASELPAELIPAG